MFLLYNILQLIFLPILAPLLIILTLVTPKYRGRMQTRLGFGLRSHINNPLPGQMTIWIHALSVGEVTSTVPLVEGLRKKYPASRIVLSVSTRSGEAIARTSMVELVDHIIPSPLDFLPVIAFFFTLIKPQLFILVETDFWPNFLLYLQYKKVPTVLVNGRISEKSLTGYKRFAFFFRPMFHSFCYLFMQTKLDQENLVKFGIDKKRIKVFGNLKFDTQITEKKASIPSLSKLIPHNKLLITAGSTHQGEEEILFATIRKIQGDFPRLMLIIVPRNPNRSDEICSLAREHGLSIAIRSKNNTAHADILLVDTIGELVSFYALSDIAFVGGSLVEEGGHNPIEPAIFGIPVLFGPNMHDFHEIAASLINSGGGEQVCDSQTLQFSLESLLSSEKLRHKRGTAAKACVFKQRGVVNRHLELLQTLL